MIKRLLYFFLLITSILKISALTSGCGQIMAPTGGPRDTIPPQIINISPKNRTTNFTGNRIIINFNEYVQIQDLQQNLFVSPAPKINPYVDYKLKTVTIRLRDTLEPNTTYTINLGNSIRDINENNPVKNFSYVFSTGPTIDSLRLSGKVLLAETGKTDSTLMVLLYKNLNDSAVKKQKPVYMARLDGSGNFSFDNLAQGRYKIYALKDENGNRIYDAKTEMFAFSDTPVIVSNSTRPVTLFAYAEEKAMQKASPSNEKTFKYSTKVATEKQDVLEDLIVEFNKPVKAFNPKRIVLADTLNNAVKDVTVMLDSTGKKIVLKNNWKQDTEYKLIILKDVAADTTGLTLSRSDTIRFKTKKESDYGTLKLKFINLDKTKNPVLQLSLNNEVVSSYALTSERWIATLISPGEYELRILYDENKNGKWDAGNFSLKKQPEKVYLIPQKTTVKENFEKDIDIELPAAFTMPNQ